MASSGLIPDHPTVPMTEAERDAILASVGAEVKAELLRCLTPTDATTSNFSNASPTISAASSTPSSS